ncbi:hypothetical protein CYLTODRAFT_422121 [Cylindrobasidium torrendii FP15055 ss-10]|uniref:F-box domain-containing protein n=1 Tax=Cylindrobasidium torrendii FP15055 ss-10 TaxID=1314674 RepID=A0A0D7BCL5_9AGAR|nr:hypothetical protein CYLTODRAFT_422121 [Cylindrobasidium torrendii FP15055 ss-10]
MTATRMNLPPELWREVVCMLHANEDRTTLQSCQLVSKAWLQLTRPFVHEKVLLRSASQAVAFLGVLAQNPAIRPCVRTLEISETRIGGNIDNAGRWLNKSLPSLVMHLPHVEKLVFVNVLHDALSSSSMILLHHGFRRVRGLTLQRVRFASSQDFNAFLSSFPELERVELLNLQVVSHTVVRPDNSKWSVPKRLGVLDVDNVDWFIDSMDWITKSKSPSSLLDLTMPLLSDLARFGVIGSFLKSCVALERLCLQWQIHSTTGYHGVGDAVKEHIDLSHNTNLRAIHLDLICVLPLPDTDFSWVPRLLRQLPHLEEVKISIVFRSKVEHLDLFPWKALEDTFSRMCGLRESVWAFVVVMSLQRQAWNYVGEKLPELKQKGKLRFEEV